MNILYSSKYGVISWRFKYYATGIKAADRSSVRGTMRSDLICNSQPSCLLPCFTYMVARHAILGLEIGSKSHPTWEHGITSKLKARCPMWRTKGSQQGQLKDFPHWGCYTLWYTRTSGQGCRSSILRSPCATMSTNCVHCPGGCTWGETPWSQGPHGL